MFHTSLNERENTSSVKRVKVDSTNSNALQTPFIICNCNCFFPFTEKSTLNSEHIFFK